jgi:hypothetical protein
MDLGLKGKAALITGASKGRVSKRAQHEVDARVRLLVEYIKSIQKK